MLTSDKEDWPDNEIGLKRVSKKYLNNVWMALLKSRAPSNLKVANVIYMVLDKRFWMKLPCRRREEKKEERRKGIHEWEKTTEN